MFHRPDESLLVVIDVQERLCRAMPDFEAGKPRLLQGLRAAGLLSVPVVVTEQYPKGLGPTDPEVKEACPTGSAVYEKTTFSCWGSAEFASAVVTRAPRTLVLTGMETHVCVQQTALTAVAKGFQTVLLADAVWSRCGTDRDVALVLLRQAGVIVTTVEALAFAWMQDSKHPAFKAVSALFRNA